VNVGSVARASGAVKLSQGEQKHFTQRRKVVEGANKTIQFFFASLCARARRVKGDLGPAVRDEVV